MRADAPGRLANLCREALYLLRHDGKPSAGVTGARRFDRGVQRQQVCLSRNSPNEATHLADPYDMFAEAVHHIRRRFHFSDGTIGDCRSMTDLTAYAVDCRKQVSAPPMTVATSLAT